MLLQSQRALCICPGGPESTCNDLGTPVRSTRMSGRFACGFRTDLHFAVIYDLYSYEPNKGEVLSKILVYEFEHKIKEGRTCVL